MIAVGIWKRRAARDRHRNMAELALRDRSGQTAPLLRRWRHGHAELEPGLIRLMPYLPLGFRMRRPRTRPVCVEVKAIRLDVRRVEGLENWFVSGMVHEIDTGDSTVEVVCGHLQDPLWLARAIRPR